MAKRPTRAAVVFSAVAGTLSGLIVGAFGVVVLVASVGTISSGDLWGWLWIVVGVVLTAAGALRLWLTIYLIHRRSNTVIDGESRG